VQVTNDLTGESLVLNISGPGKIIPTDDGLTLLAYGPWNFGQFPTDSPPTSLLLLTGQTGAHIDPATGQQTLISHEGTVRDLCAELA
jgi:hypothetical protein